MKLGFDILFFLILAGSAVGSFFLGDERAQRLMVGSLVGVFAATQLAVPLTKLTSNIALLNYTTICFILLGVSLLVFMLPKRLREKKWPKHKPRSGISGFLAAFFVLAFGISFLPLDTRTALVTDHNLAAITYDLRFFILGVLLVWLMVTVLLIGKAKR